MKLFSAFALLCVKQAWGLGLGHQNVRMRLSDAKNDTVLPTRWASIPIDHDDHSIGTYQNRYWATAKYYKAGGPVFVFDQGEGAVNISWFDWSKNSSDLETSLLKEFGGVGIVWEHRYYGDSLPMGPINTTTPVENFKYHTIRQSLNDIPYFAENFSVPGIDADLSPRGSPWVMVGGSYPGMRSAWTRDKYPDTIFAAYASSAPVQARIDLSAYFEIVYRGMLANGYAKCAHDIHEAMEYIDSQLDQDTTANKNIKELFFGKGGRNSSNGKFANGLYTIYNYFQGWGMGEGHNSTVAGACDWIGAGPIRSNTTMSHTTVTYGNGDFHNLTHGKVIAERLASWPHLTRNEDGTSCKDFQSGPESCLWTDLATSPDGISWTWQYCSEFGYYQTDNVYINPHHGLLSKYLDLAYYQDGCNRQFPGALLPSSPTVEKTNNMTGGWSIRPSNTFWTAGEFDPWRPLSPLSDEIYAPPVEAKTDIPQCNRETAKRELFGYVLKNGNHCSDFNRQDPEARFARKLFSTALKEWLKCWTKK